MSATKEIPPRKIKTFEAADDVDRMLERAKRDGRKLGWLVNEGLRLKLRELGYARKKELV